VAESVDLTGVFLPLLDGERVPLDETFSSTQLADMFIESWVRYLECHKCGRSDYCKFTKPNPYGSGKPFAEIQCGVVASVIRNYVQAVFPLLRSMPKEELQAFIDGSYHLVEFVYDIEIRIGHMIDEGVIEWMGKPEYRVFFFGNLQSLRKNLDQFAHHMALIEVFGAKRTLILVEGASEQIFLEALRRGGLLWFSEREVQSYHGKGNKKTANLALLVARLRAQGYEVFLQGDCDGVAKDIFGHLVKAGLLQVDNQFAFLVDFETAFPAEILYQALTAMGFLDGVSSEDFLLTVASRPPDESVLEIIRKKYLISPEKT
jgi:hypothetical protein